MNIEELKDFLDDNGKTKQDQDIKTLLSQSLISQTDELPVPEVVLEISSEIKNAMIATAGEISAISGKAKGRKTFFLSMCIAAILYKNGWLQNKIRRGILRKYVAILFDTEQGKYHTQKVQHRILKLIGKERCPDLLVYNLRQFGPKVRLEIIEHAIENTPDLIYVGIDGIKDLCFDINDSTEATLVTGKLMQLSQIHNIHITCVLHENKGGDNNLRGHLGTELTNKAETVISVNKHPKHKDYSVVQCEYSRNIDFDSFFFFVNDSGLPVIDTEFSEADEKKDKKNFHPADFDQIEHLKVLSEIFSTNVKPGYGELWRMIGNSLKVADNKAKSIVTFYVQKGWITIIGKEGTRHSYYQFSYKNLPV